jgi:hypothetical protein
MTNNDLLGLVLSGFIGALTNLFHALYRNTIKDFRQLLIRFTISILAICPAYLFCAYMNFDRNITFIIGYIFGILGDRMVNELYRREKKIYDFFIGDMEKNDAPFK